ncbi:MAG: zf-HC2 domain-containing protein [Myxococcota bacterium]
MLTCRELSQVITDYLEGRMPLAQRVSLFLHVGMCRGCREYLRQMRLTIKTLRQMPPASMPPEVKEELLRRLGGMRRNP